MTVSEAEAFFQSREYAEGVNNNTSEDQPKVTPATTGTASGIASAEDWQVETWKNPDSGITVSYAPFDPFATPAPLPENDIRNKEYLDSLAERIRKGSLKEEDLERLLETAYRDSADKETIISSALNYVREKLGTEIIAEETATPEAVPMETEENSQYEQEKGGSALGWIIGGLLLAGAGGGGYVYYSSVQKKRQAAQRLAQKKAEQQRKVQTAGKQPSGSSGTQKAQPVSAQQAAKVRTGTYTEKNGATASKPAGTAGSTGKPYSKTMENPYGRYTSSGEEDATYTASFKPGENRKTNGSRRRSGGTGNGETKT